MTRIVILLPETPPPAPDLHWWQIEAEGVVEQGCDARWLAFAGQEDAEVIALAPTAGVRLTSSRVEGSTDQQARAVAAAQARNSSVAEPATLHTVADVLGEGDERRVWTAVVANGAMLLWLDWLRSLGCDPSAIVPSGAILLPTGGRWQEARVGNEALLGCPGQVLSNEPEIAELLVGDAAVESLTASDVEARLVQLATAVPLNLRVGRFARRRVFVLDWARVRALASLSLLIPLLGLIMALVTIVRLNSHSAGLERETAALASEYLGRTVTASQAASELEIGAQQRGGTGGSPFATVAILYRHLQAGSGVTSTAMAWRSDATLVTTLAATRAADLNRVLVALQGSGYRITAVPRQAPDGRTMADVTVRSAQ